MSQPVFPSQALFTRSAGTIETNFKASPEAKALIQELAEKYAFLIDDKMTVSKERWIEIIKKHYDNPNVHADCDRLNALETMTRVLFDGDITLEKNKRASVLFGGTNLDDVEAFILDGLDPLFKELEAGIYSLGLYVAQGGELTASVLEIE